MRAQRFGVLSLIAAVCCAATVDRTEESRRRYAMAGQLEVTLAEVDDQSVTDGPVRVTMRCRLTQAGTYASSLTLSPRVAGGRC